MTYFGKILGNYNWLGKLFGAFFGFLIAKAPGALIGLLIGNFFDRALASYFSHQGWQHIGDKAAQEIFLETVFSIMGYLAKIDGPISKAEIDHANVVMDEMNLNKKQKTSARNFFTKGKTPGFNMHALLGEFKKAVSLHRSLLHTFIEMQYRLIQVEGVNEKKIAGLNAVLAQLGFAALHQQNRFYEQFNFKARHSQQRSSFRSQPSFSNDYAILGVEPNSSKEVIKKSYRRLISQHHPDKLIAKGASEAAIRAANDKTQAIRKAYERIVESKGW